MKTLQLLLATTLLAVSAASAQSFEVATIKPAPGADPDSGSWSLPGTGNFNATHVSLVLLIQLAYQIGASQIINKPAWLDFALFDIAARPEDGIKLSREELKPRLQDLLRQRFHLVTHVETHEVRGFALVAASGGPHLTVTKAERSPGWKTDVSPGQMRGINWSMATFARYLTPFAGFPVVDQTGLTGSYDIAFSFAPDTTPDAAFDITLPPLAAALKQATGLQLKPQKVPVQTLVIDSINQVPTAN